MEPPEKPCWQLTSAGFQTRSQPGRWAHPIHCLAGGLQRSVAARRNLESQMAWPKRLRLPLDPPELRRSAFDRPFASIPPSVGLSSIAPTRRPCLPAAMAAPTPADVAPSTIRSKLRTCPQALNRGAAAIATVLLIKVLRLMAAKFSVRYRDIRSSASTARGIHPESHLCMRCVLSS